MNHPALDNAKRVITEISAQENGDLPSAVGGSIPLARQVGRLAVAVLEIIAALEEDA